MRIIKKQTRVALKKTALIFAWLIVFLIITHWLTAGHDEIIESKLANPISDINREVPK